MSTTTAQTGALFEESLVNFKTRFSGKVVVSTDAEYDEARALWNGVVDKKPRLIAQCKYAQDAMNTLTLAREKGLTVAVRTGGHNVAGLASVDGGVVIDLSPMNAVAVDPEKRRVKVEGGATWADVDNAAQAFGLATPADHSTIDVWYHGGAVANRDEGATAFGRRDLPYLVNPEANWEDPADDEANIAWAKNLLKDLKPYSEAALYLNFPGFLEEGDVLVKAAFGKNYERLSELKTKYDPQNLFKLNHNIKPKAPRGADEQNP